MLDQEREFIIEKREECVKKRDGIRPNLTTPLFCFGFSLGILAAQKSGILPYGQFFDEGFFDMLRGSFTTASFLTPALESLWKERRKNDFSNQIDDYNKLLNGLETEQNQQIEKEGKSR